MFLPAPSPTDVSAALARPRSPWPDVPSGSQALPGSDILRVVTYTTATHAIRADEPIRHSAQDVFGRNSFARAIAEEALSLPRDASFVVGIEGPWGSGKSSILNLLSDHISPEEKATLFRFEPWLFSSQEDLLLHFLGDFSAHLRSHDNQVLARVADNLDRYASTLAPLRDLPSARLALIGTVANATRTATRAVRDLFGRARSEDKMTATALRDKLSQQLLQSGEKVIVIIDDLDRLMPDEVREVVRLIRLVAPFPGVIYVVAYDRPKVVEALGSDGSAYLAKIMQMTYHVPALDARQLSDFLLDEIGRLLEPLPAREIDAATFNSALSDIIAPLVRTPRDVRRITAILPAAIKRHRKEIALADLITMETVRVTAPSLHQKIVDLRHALTASRGYQHEQERQQLLDEIDESLLEAPDANPQLVKSIKRIMFPYTEKNTKFGFQAIDSWRRACRIAHREVFELYLRGIPAAGTVAASEMERLVAAGSNRSSFSRELTRIGESRFRHVLQQIVVYSSEFSAGSIEPVALEILSRYSEMGGETSILFGPNMSVTTAIYSLFYDMAPSKRADAAANIARMADMSGMLAIIFIVGHDEGVGGKLVEMHAWEELCVYGVERIEKSEASDFHSERDFYRLLWWYKRKDGSSNVIERLLSDHVLFTKFLRGSVIRQFDNVEMTETRLELRRSSIEEVIGFPEFCQTLGLVTSVPEDERDLEALRLARKLVAGDEDVVVSDTFSA